VVELVNQARADNGDLPPLKRVDPLDQAGRYYAVDMEQDDYYPSPPLISHGTYDRIGGNLQFVCAWGARVSSYYTNWMALAENIAAGQTSPDMVMNDPTWGWMYSPGHRANILSTDVWEIGVGYRSGPPYGHYWVQDFGRRIDVYPLIINREAAETESLVVSIYIYGDWDVMRLRNDSNEWPASWQVFQSEFSWTLANVSGERTVEAQLRTGGVTVTSNDIIIYNGPTVPLQKIFVPLVIK
jgi:hypothetical protein